MPRFLEIIAKFWFDGPKSYTFGRITRFDFKTGRQGVGALSLYFAIDKNFEPSGQQIEQGVVYRTSGQSRYEAAQRFEREIHKSARSSVGWALYEQRGGLLTYMGDLSDLITWEM